LRFDSKELLLACKYTAKVIENKRRHIVEQNVQLLKTNAAILLNKMCRTKQLTPKYIRINHYPANVENMVSS
jgi:hypothetical protein